MKLFIQGNFVTFSSAPDDGQPGPIQLPAGYSFEKIRIVRQDNVSHLFPYLQTERQDVITFPPINSKSPCIIQPLIIDTTKSSIYKLIIEKFGQIPDTHYFDKAFEPILVTGDDGNEYKVIPSDQFK